MRLADLAAHPLVPTASLPTASQISFYSRVCSLYIDTIRQHLLPPADGDDGALAGTEPSTSSSSAGPVPFPEADLARWSHTLSTLHLARILYMPADGRGDGVVGEELLDWVNLTDCGPTEEEGEAILAGPGGAHAWRHPEFWSYLLRSLLRGFLSSAAQLLLTLGSHPASQLAALAPRLAGHLAAYPRSSSEEFATERAFVQAHAQWRASLRLLTRPLTPGWARASWLTDGEDVEGEAQAVEESVGALVELLAGGEARVLEESVDWKEALGAWGVWVRPGLKRDDLPSTVDHILAALPLAAADDDDEEDEEDGAGEEAVQTALLRGDCTTAATAANECSLWLATHLTDLLGHLGLIPRSPAVLVRRAHAHGGPVLGRSLRDHYVLEYAGHLAADRALWQLASNYAGRVAGPEGRMTVGALLSAVSLDREVDGDAAEGDDDEEPRVDQEKVEEILKLYVLRARPPFRDRCLVLTPLLPRLGRPRRMHEHGLEEQARALARTVAERLVREREFGLAVAFGVRASDARKLETIADRVLDVYVRQGPAPFVNHVESIPTSLLDPLNAPPSSVGAPTLAFLPLYRQFLAAYDQGQRDVAADVLVRAFRSGLAPRAFWAVLMVDLVPLLDGPSRRPCAMLLPALLPSCAAGCR